MRRRKLLTFQKGGEEGEEIAEAKATSNPEKAKKLEEESKD